MPQLHTTHFKLQPKLNAVWSLSLKCGVWCSNYTRHTSNSNPN